MDRHVAIVSSLPCVSAGIRIPCAKCIRYFRIQKCFDNRKNKKVKSSQSGHGKKGSSDEMFNSTAGKLVTSRQSVSMQQTVFCLRRNLAIEQNRTVVCTHESVAETALTVTWVLDEIMMSVHKVYELV